MMEIMRVLLAISVAVNVFLGINLYDKTKIEIIEEHGYQVVKDHDLNRSTIIARVVTGDADEDGYIITENLYDAKDTVAIDKQNFKKGDIVEITFKGDIVEKVKKRG